MTRHRGDRATRGTEAGSADTGAGSKAGRRTTSVEWPVEVDERLRLLARLAVVDDAEIDPAPTGGKSRPTPSAARVLSNLILSHPLTGVAHLGVEPGPEALARAREVNESFAWVHREPWFGRPRSRVYETPPERVVLRRGRPLPPNTVSVARPSRFGNPWKIIQRDGAWCVEQPRGNPKPYASRARAHTVAVELYRAWLDGDLGHVDTTLEARRQRILDDLGRLRGKNLACYCTEDLECHVDDLLERANPVPS
ncbi:DUF4326 domain-containing protein [Candidatus Mycobacterium methanotrophicum]|uniref:DUF4326 domain-containing protein n=1 Tax=Candidatus Mycobacterium methanotrophicum TaxID=2943498 RepID=A0ABY4QSC1_9MYCO|nr:DUF4326 domain-containing protein [Candidatus Mycobacterium methanotrophicum]UQX13579.1 DUF4326 domain-containing protein [Candidatus Mycobacterium methanotrophicum]